MPTKISRAQARQLILQQQGLLEDLPFGQGKKGLLATIQQLGYIQIDTISVIERAHHHTLWLRLPDYQKDELLELQEKNKSIFEYWSHAAAYLPMEDFRFSLPRKRQIKEKDNYWFKREPKVMQFVKDRIKAEGPLMSKDFKPPKDRKGGAWWDWKPTKRALENLFHEGELMVLVRRNFQKVYDLTERVLPKEVNTKMPTKEEYARHLIFQTVQAQGLAQLTEMTYLRTNMKSVLAKELKTLVENKQLLEFHLENSDNVYYSTPLIIKSLNDTSSSKCVKLLNPFDNTIIQRQRVRDFFGFDYKLECYVPAAKRVFGYYSLAVLFGDEFVAHLDLKADRKEKALIIKKLTFKLNYKASDQFWHEYQLSLKRLAVFNQCKEIKDIKNKM